MPLAFQRIPVSFYQGLDTKSDPKQVMQGRLLELQNGIFTSPGQIRKRSGLTSLDRDIQGGDSFESGSALGTFADQRLLFTGERAYSRLEATDAWLDRGPLASVITSTDQVIRNGYLQSNPDVAYVDGLEVYAWEDSRGGCRYSVVDSETRAPIVQDAQLTPVGSVVRLVTFNTGVHMLYVDGNTVKSRRIAATTPSALGNEVALSTTIETSSYGYDALVASGSLFLAFCNVTGTVTLEKFNSSLASQGAVNVAGSPGPVALWSDPSENVWLANLSASSIVGRAYTPALSTLLTASALVPSSTVRNLAGVSVTGSVSTLYWEVSAANPTDRFVQAASLSVNVPPGDPAVFCRSVALASKPFARGDRHYLWTVHASDEQPAYFCLDPDSRVISKANALSAGGLRANRTLSHVPNTGGSAYRFAGGQRGRLVSEEGIIFSMLGVSSTELDFSSPYRFLSTELAQNLHVVGGILQGYDGVGFSEHGFHVYPEDLAGLAVPAGGYLSNGQYQYVATYEWIDGQGQVHRSLPTVSPLTISPGSGAGVIVSVPTLRVTDKENVQVCIYRTEANGSIFYKVTSPTVPTFNTGSVDLVAYFDTLSDTNLISREILYTEGGALGNDPPPPCTLVTSFGGRVWLGGLEDPDQLWYSKVPSEGDPVSFSAAFTIRIDKRGGPITALAPLDSNLVVFKRGAIHVVNGPGPNNLGQGAPFAQSLITTDVGCVNPNSVVTTDAGLFFQSTKGIYLLGRNLSVQYVGAPVEGYNDLTISSATLVADTNQVRFTTEEGTGLVYDYAAGQWSTFTNYAAVDSDIWDDTFVLLRSDGTVAQEDPTSFTDDGDRIRMRIASGWLNFAGLQGFQRVRRMYVLGEHRGDHQLRVQFAFDGGPFSQEALLDVTSIMALTAYGEDSPYGSGSPYGGAHPLYQFRVDPQTQKCSSIRVLLEDVEDGSPGESMSLSNMAFEVGIKNGGPKLGPSRQAGASRID